MLTIVSFSSLRLERLILAQAKIRDSSASLIGGHVVQLYQTDLDSGTFPMGHKFHHNLVLHFIEPEEMMEQST